MEKRIETVKSEDGQALVLFALFMVVLMCAAALVIDFGNVAVVKSNLQNAVDAAALAGAQDLSDAHTAEDTAKSYAELNGVQASEITVEADSTQIKVICTRTVPYTFAKVLGFQDTTVQATSVAQKATVGGDAFGYAVFAGAGAVSFNGSKHEFGGSVYGRDGVNLGKKAHVTGNVVCANNHTIDTGNITPTGTFITNSPEIPMPDLSDRVIEQAGTSTYTGNTTLGGNSINGPVYVNGDLTVNGHIAGKGIIYVNGNIDFSNIDQTALDSVCFYAAGDITFDGGVKTMGILYAPNGTIKINGGGNTTVYGRMIAKVIDVNGGQASVYPNANDLDGIKTLETVKLTQ